MSTAEMLTQTLRAASMAGTSKDLFVVAVVVVAVAVAVPAVPDNQFHVMSKPVIVADPNKGVKVDAAVVAKPFREEIQKQVKELKEQGIGTYKTCLEIKDSY